MNGSLYALVLIKICASSFLLEGYQDSYFYVKPILVFLNLYVLPILAILACLTLYG